MNKHYLVTTAMILVAAAVIGGLFAVVYTAPGEYRETASGGEAVASAKATAPVFGGNASGAAVTATGEVVFSPPHPSQAPPEIKDAVMYGYNILMETQKYAPSYVGNKLNCRNCHFDAGRMKDTLSLVGVAAIYPKYRKRSDYATDLVTRTEGCFERSMNGTPPPPDSKEMEAIMAYYQWISKGIPIYADVPWLGLKKLESNHAPEVQQGMAVYSSTCAVCHGPEGQGTGIAPPLWGDGSFNDGAGMNKPDNFAAFAFRFMPRGKPSLTQEQAIDVAAFATTRPRPHFQSKSSRSASGGR